MIQMVVGDTGRERLIMENRVDSAALNSIGDGLAKSGLSGSQLFRQTHGDFLVAVIDASYLPDKVAQGLWASSRPNAVMLCVI